MGDLEKEFQRIQDKLTRLENRDYRASQQTPLFNSQLLNSNQEEPESYPDVYQYFSVEILISERMLRDIEEISVKQRVPIPDLVAEFIKCEELALYPLEVHTSNEGITNIVYSLELPAEGHECYEEEIG